MKRIICSSTSNSLANAIASSFGVSKEAANIVAQWYMNEDILEDYDDLEDALDYIRDDLPDMLEAASDPDEIQTVGAEFGIDVDYLLGEDEF